MKRACAYLLMIFLSLSLGSALELRCEDNVRMHPRNRELIQRGLIPPMKFFPDVPRITPAEARSLYESGGAVFIGVGMDVPRLPNGWLLKNYMAFDPRRLKIPKNRLIVTYCGCGWDAGESARVAQKSRRMGLTVVTVAGGWHEMKRAGMEFARAEFQSLMNLD